jgi:hypothetical protein
MIEQIFMKQLITSLAVAATILSQTVPAIAAPFDPKDVAADPAVLVHLDCDALRASSLGKDLLSQQDIQKQLSMVAALFNFDFRTQLHGLTIYTTAKNSKEGVLIVYADFDASRLTALAQAASGSRAVTNGSHVIYSWVQKKEDADSEGDARVYGTIVGHRVLFSKDASIITQAVAVLDGSSPNYSGKEGLPGPDANESVILQGVVLKFPFDSADQNAAIFKMSKSARLKLGEVGDNIRATVHLEAADPGTALQMSAIAQGLLAVLKLQKTNTAVLDLANSIDIRQDGSSVAIALSMPSAHFTDKVKAMKDGGNDAGAGDKK